MKLVKVKFEYLDGSYTYIDADELEKWINYTYQVSAFAKNHGVNPPFEEIKWTKIGKDTKY